MWPNVIQTHGFTLLDILGDSNTLIVISDVNFYVNNVTVAPHRTAPQSGRTIRIEFRSFEDFSEQNFSADLFAAESVEDLMVSFMEPYVKSLGAPVTESVKKDLRVIAADLIDAVGENVDWLSIDTIERINAFHQRCQERIFTNTLRAYRITNRLTYDQALRVLQEHYVIEPVMES